MILKKIYSSFIILLFLSISCVDNDAKERILNLRCEYMTSPLGLDVANPRLMWNISSNSPVKQLYYRVLVATSAKSLTEGIGDVWDSQKIKSDEQLVYYDGPLLGSHKRYYWKLETWLDNRKIESDVTWFETGKMQMSEWTGKWITDKFDCDYEPSPMFRKDFQLKDNIESAHCYISGVGYYELFINGNKVGHNLLDPGFTDYSKRVLYTTYDVTDMIRTGKNAVGVQLGNGWFNEQTPTVWYFHEAPWRNRPCMVCEVHVKYKNGDSYILNSDNTWKTSIGPLLFDNIHVGVIYDARLEEVGWNTSSFNSSLWNDVKIVDCPSPLIESMKMPPIRSAEQIAPVSFDQINDSTFVFDFGVNFAGVCLLNVTGSRGTLITLTHAEMLDTCGLVDQRNINMHLRPRNAKEIIQTDRYFLKGEGLEEFSPAFTYHGFRYVQVVASKPCDITINSLMGLVMHSDVEKIGSFECSDSLLNSIHEISNRSYLSNLFGIPTDCPTREKNGWMADGFMVQEAGMFSYDSRNIYAKWVKDMVDAQGKDGNVPGIVPTSWVWDSNWAGPIWDAAMFIVPFQLYKYTGDVEVIKDVYSAAKRYLHYIETTVDDRGLINHGLGDWLYYKAETPVDFMTSSYVYYNYKLMSKMSLILGEDKDSEMYLSKADSLKCVINDVFFDVKSVSYSTKTQLSYALPLYLDLVPVAYRSRLADNLRQMVVDNDYSLDYGFIGSVMVPEALSAAGYTEEAFLMATKTTLPSWGYWIKETGATSLYETWDVKRHIGDASLNHPSMGAISSWMYKYLAGIRCDEGSVAFKRIIIQPGFVKELDWVRASYKSQQGMISSEWKRKGDIIELEILIPPTSEATVILPNNREEELEGGRYSFEVVL